MARVLSLFRQHPLLSLARTQATPRTMSLDSRAREVFAAAVEAVRPDTVVRRSVEREKDAVVIGGHRFALAHNLHLVGFGKAVLGMASEVERILGDHLVKGVVSVPSGIREMLLQNGKTHLLLKENSSIRVVEGGKHNLPDEDALRAAEEIGRLASDLSEQELLLVLISGGGSALLPAPVPPVSLREKLEVTRRLAAAGATIQELNTVRRALSVLKGGGLARCAHPAQVVALILSDVIGDPVDLIASGPTAGGERRPEEARAVLERYELLASVPASVRDVLWQAEDKDKTAPPGRVHNVVIGSNGAALQSAGRRARELGFRPVVMSPGVCGDVRSVARLYGLLARFACAPGEPPPEVAAELLELGPVVGVKTWDLHRTMQVLSEGRAQEWGATCLLAGGEPTVELTGKGRGGRNQELAMRVGLELRGLDLPPQGPVFLSGGTDGQDGPTKAAGAVTDAGLSEEARAQGLDIRSALADNDSFTFFTGLSGGRRLLLPGLTCTNVMDVHVLLTPPAPVNV